METVKGPAEQRVILHNASWDTYERLMEERGERRVPRFAYDRGELEIMSPSTEHEHTSHIIALVVEVLAAEMGVNVYGVGSTTFEREDIQRGFEPDACFYVQNEERVRGKPRIELGVDPSPDLVVEVDITSPSLDKFPIYAQIGVPEVWLHNGEHVSIFVLRGSGYEESAASAAFPPLSDQVLSRFVEESRTLGSAAWTRGVREWAHDHARPSN